MKKLILILTAFLLLTSFTSNESKHLNQEASWITLPHPLPSDSFTINIENLLPRYEYLYDFGGITFLEKPNFPYFIGFNSYDWDINNYNEEDYNQNFDSVLFFINDRYFIVTPNEKGNLTITELAEY